MPEMILLTGATGALGPHLAAELLARQAGDHVSALVRSTAVSVQARFDRWVETVCSIRCGGGATWPPDPARLHLVPGDIAEEGLGLAAAQRDALARQTQVIIHAAADTHFRGPAEMQWNVNVEGTRRMLEWAAGCPRLRQFILVSTICVAGTSSGRITETFAAPPAFLNQYEQTKWEAERLALASSLPVRVARVGVVMGSHATGVVHRLGALHHVLRWFGRGLIRVVPGTPRSSVDLIAVETAARFLARAAAEQGADRAIWHVTAGERAVGLQELMDFTWQQFNPAPVMANARRAADADAPRIVDAATFARLRRSADPRRAPALGHLIESIDSFLPGLLYPRTFDTTQAEKLWGGPLPLTDWRETLGRVIRFINQHPANKTSELAMPA